MSVSERRWLFQTNLSNHAFSDLGHCRGCCCKTSTGSIARPTCITFDFTSNGRVSTKKEDVREEGDGDLLEDVLAAKRDSSDLPYSRAFTMYSLCMLLCNL